MPDEENTRHRVLPGPRLRAVRMPIRQHDIAGRMCTADRGVPRNVSTAG
jgi:hypothetical protein